MIDKALAKIFGTKHEREIKKMRPMVAAINDLEPQMQALSNEDLAAQTVKFREQLAQGVELVIVGLAGERAPEAFAASERRVDLVTGVVVV